VLLPESACHNQDMQPAGHLVKLLANKIMLLDFISVHYFGLYFSGLVFLEVMSKLRIDGADSTNGQAKALMMRNGVPTLQCTEHVTAAWTNLHVRSEILLCP